MLFDVFTVHIRFTLKMVLKGIADSVAPVCVVSFGEKTTSPAEKHLNQARPQKSMTRSICFGMNPCFQEIYRKPLEFNSLSIRQSRGQAGAETLGYLNLQVSGSWGRWDGGGNTGRAAVGPEAGH
jgi:hypothetical protein